MRPRRAAAAAAILAFAVAVAIVVYSRSADAIITDSDFAVGEWYTELAARGELLVGPYSRFTWHHPGPMLFYLTAPFYALSGHRAPALYAVALAINLASIATIVWITASDRRRWPLALILTSGLLLLVFRLPWFLASPWNAHLTVLACLACVVLAAAGAAGRPSLLPLLAAFASFVTQTHVGFLPLILAVVLAALTAAFFGSSLDRRAFWKGAGWAGLVLLMLWALPIAEAVLRSGGNVAALVKFFSSTSESGHPASEAVSNLSYGLTGVLRPGLELPWSGHFQLTHLSWAIPAALAQLVLLAAIAVFDLRRERRFEGFLALFALIASLVGGLSLTRIRGDILNHELLRFTALGVLNFSIIGAAAARSVLGADTGLWRVRPLALGIAGILFVAVGIRDLESFTSFERRRTERIAIVSAYTAIRDHLRAQGIRRPLLQIDDDQWSVAAGIVLRLRQNGVVAAVDDDIRWMFTDAAAANNEEDALISLSNLARHQDLQRLAGTFVLYESSRVFVTARRLARPIAR